jgi:hypothetical protein
VCLCVCVCVLCVYILISVSLCVFVFCSWPVCPSQWVKCCHSRPVPASVLMRWLNVHHSKNLSLLWDLFTMYGHPIYWFGPPLKSNSFRPHSPFFGPLQDPHFLENSIFNSLHRDLWVVWSVASSFAPIWNWQCCVGLCRGGSFNLIYRRSTNISCFEISWWF